MQHATNGSNGAPAEPKLKRSMGLWMATALVIGNMVGSGIFLRAITGSGKDIIAKGFVLLLAGIPVYVLVKWWGTRQAPTPPAVVGALEGEPTLQVAGTGGSSS